MPLNAINVNSTLDPNDLLYLTYRQDLKLDGSRIRDARFEEIDLSDLDKISSLREGTIYSYIGEDGTPRFRCRSEAAGGEDLEFVYRAEALGFVELSLAKLKRIAVTDSFPISFPAEPNNEPSLYSGRELVFAENGTIDGAEVQKGGIAILTRDIPVGQRPTWSDLVYNGPGISNVQISDIELVKLVRIDGTATHEKGTSEKSVADLVLLQRSELNQRISSVESSLSLKIQNVEGDIVSISRNVGDNEQSITSLQANQDSLITTSKALEESQVDHEARLSSNEEKIAGTEEFVAGFDTKLKTLTNENDIQNSRLVKLESMPQLVTEEVIVGDAETKVFCIESNTEIVLETNFTNILEVQWYILIDKKYSQQVVIGEHISYHEGKWVVEVGFSERPSKGQFKLKVIGFKAFEAASNETAA